MKSVDRHLIDLLEGVSPLESVVVDFLDAAGAVLAEDVVSRVDLPIFDNSSMDGYAVYCADLTGATEHDPVVLAVVGDVGAGSAAPTATPGAAVRVMTGAPVPVGADAVVPVEWTDGGTERVAITRQPEPGAPEHRSNGSYSDIGIYATKGPSAVDAERQVRMSGSRPVAPSMTRARCSTTPSDLAGASQPVDVLHNG